MKSFFLKNKKPIIIFTVALLVIVAAYYFTLGPGSKPKTEGSSDGSTSGGSTSDSFTSSGATTSGSTFPIKWGVKNTYCVKLQQRLNLSQTCALRPVLVTDGILGPATLAAIKGSFPTIGATVESTRQVSESQYNTIINSKPSCA